MNYRTSVAVVISMVLSAGFVAAQSKSAGPASTGSDAGAAVTYRGCLGPGSAPDTYVLTSAKEKGKKDAEKVSLIVVPAEKVKLDFWVLKEVEITGTVKGSVSGSAESGQVLPTMTATKAKTTADYCG